MLFVLLDLLCKLSIIGIFVNLIIHYLKYFEIDIVKNVDNKFNNYNRITVPVETMKKLNEKFKLNLNTIESKYDILHSLRNDLKDMNIQQVKKYLISQNYLLGILSKDSDKKFISKGRLVVLCEFENGIFQDAVDIGDFILNNDELPGVNIL